MPFPLFIIMVTIVTLPNDQKFDCADLSFMGGSCIEVIFAPKKKAKKVVKMLRSFVYTFISKSSFFVRTNRPDTAIQCKGRVNPPIFRFRFVWAPCIILFINLTGDSNESNAKSQNFDSMMN